MNLVQIKSLIAFLCGLVFLGYSVFVNPDALTAWQTLLIGGCIFGLPQFAKALKDFKDD